MGSGPNPNSPYRLLSAGTFPQYSMCEHHGMLLNVNAEFLCIILLREWSTEDPCSEETERRLPSTEKDVRRRVSPVLLPGDFISRMQIPGYLSRTGRNFSLLDTESVWEANIVSRTPTETPQEPLRKV